MEALRKVSIIKRYADESGGVPLIDLLGKGLTPRPSMGDRAEAPLDGFLIMISYLTGRRCIFYMIMHRPMLNSSSAVSVTTATPHPTPS